jgi:antitoxin component YwqK of YwqJK toxin-antitoxin module
MFACSKALSCQIARQWRSLLILFLVFWFIQACGSPVQRSETYKRGRLVYQLNAEEPFTGTVVGKGRLSYHRQRLRFEKTYKKGLQDGVTKYWYDNGQLESVIPYKRGKIDGIVVRYYANGKRRSKIHYVEGLRGGNQGEIFWSRDGRVRKG